jgi:hypothetical protein
LDEIRIPDRVKERLLDYWDMEWLYNVELSRAVADVEVMLMKARGEGQTAQIKAISDALARLGAADYRRQTSEIEAKITGIDARAKAEARILERRSVAIAEAERFQRVLGAIEEVAGSAKMAELTQELIRVLTSVNDVQAVVRILGLARRPLLRGGDGRIPDEQGLNQILDQGGDEGL